MRWNTDSDIDLYTWDSAGDQAYYGDQYAIPDAELVQDIIPNDGESSDVPEVFQEDAEPGRTYTFGICVYRGDGGDVTLNVVDPNGATRTFTENLDGEGDNIVVTNSPAGAGYVPDPGWCNTIDG